MNNGQISGKIVNTFTKFNNDERDDMPVRLLPIDESLREIETSRLLCVELLNLSTVFLEPPSLLIGYCSPIFK